MLGILDEIPKMMAELRRAAEQFKGRIIFMSMYNDIIWGTQGNHETCMANSMNNIAAYAKKFPHGCWSCLGSGSEKKWYGTQVSKPNGEWNKTAEVMMLNFAESGHPVFHAISAFERGELKSKGCGKKFIHFNGSEETVDLNIRTVISVNQPSTYGTVADSCKELDPDSRNHTVGEVRHVSESNINGIVDLFQNYERKFTELPDDQKLSKLCSDAGFLKESGKGQFVIEEGSEVLQTACREYTRPRNLKTSRPTGWVRSQSWMSKSILTTLLY